MLDKKGILVAFTARNGGISSPPFNSLNLALHVGDDRDFVRKNRRLTAAALNFKPSFLTCAQQVHGIKIAKVDKSLIGSGDVDNETAIANTDALVANERQAALTIFTADCVPLILVEPSKRIVAVAHAGWRGTLSKIAVAAVEAMVSEFSALPSEIFAYIGPAIRACSYEVDEHLHQRYRSAFPEVVGDEMVLDLPTVNIHQLIKTGIEADNIFDLGLCTDCHPELFYSYRRERETGRQAAIVMIR